LTDSPACIVADDGAISANLARMLKAAGQTAPDAKPVLEINPEHVLVQRLEHETEHFGDWSRVLLDQAILAEGGHLEDPASFVKRLNTLLTDARH
jgi:molecular chaperone HtpG